GLVVAVLALLLAGTLKGLRSYQTTVATMDGRLVELRGADKIRDKVKAMVVASGDHHNLFDLQKSTKDAEEALKEYDKLLEETIQRGGGDPNNGGYLEKDQVKGLGSQFLALKEALKTAVHASIQPQMGTEPWNANDVPQEVTK